MASESAVTKVYLDACCLNRPFDDQTQARIRLESEAVLLILTRVETGLLSWVASEVLHYEIMKTPDPERRLRVSLLADTAQAMALVEQDVEDRAAHLESLGFRAFDALHLACAEGGGADVLLTTDDRLLSLSRRSAAQLHIRVENPLTWLREMEEK